MENTWSPDTSAMCGWGTLNDTKVLGSVLIYMRQNLKLENWAVVKNVVHASAPSLSLQNWLLKKSLKSHRNLHYVSNRPTLETMANWDSRLNGMLWQCHFKYRISAWTIMCLFLGNPIKLLIKYGGKHKIDIMLL